MVCVGCGACGRRGGAVMACCTARGLDSHRDLLWHACHGWVLQAAGACPPWPCAPTEQCRLHAYSCLSGQSFVSPCKCGCRCGLCFPDRRCPSGGDGARVAWRRRRRQLVGQPARVGAHRGGRGRAGAAGVGPGNLCAAASGHKRPGPPVLGMRQPGRGAGATGRQSLGFPAPGMVSERLECSGAASDTPQRSCRECGIIPDQPSRCGEGNRSRLAGRVGRTCLRQSRRAVSWRWQLMQLRPLVALGCITAPQTWGCIDCVEDCASVSAPHL